MHLRHRGVAGDVHHPDHLAIGIEDRRSRTIEDPMRGRVVLAAAHFHRAAFGDRGADRIGAHLRFMPARARHQGDAAGLVEEPGAALGIEDPAVGIGEDDDAAGARRIGGQHLHFRARQSPQLFVAFAHVAQAQRIHRFDRRATIRRQAERTAAPPRLQDRVGHLPDRRTTEVEEGAARLRHVAMRGLRMRLRARHQDTSGDVSHSATAASPVVLIHNTGCDTLQRLSMLRCGRIFACFQRRCGPPG